MRIFGPEGALSRKLPAYKPRPQQEELARLFNLGFKRNKNVIVEAPTGVGKSLSYLVPAAYRLSQGDERNFLICTATIALQEQYLQKELPFVRSLGFDFTFAMIKGMSNYLCPYKLHAIRAERANSATKLLTEWFKRTETGDLSELTPSDMMQVGSMDVRAHLDECLRQKCPFYDECPYFARRNEARSADIVVVNYHYFLAHIELALLHDVFVLLPRFTNILFDEAHVLKDLSRDFFGYSVSGGSLRGVIGFLGKHYPDTAHQLARYSKSFFEVPDSYLGGVRTRLAYDLNARFYSERYADFLKYLYQGKSLIDAEIRNFMQAVAEPSSARPLLYARKASKQIENIIALLSSLETYLQEKGKTFTGQAVWIERNKRDEITIATKPIYTEAIFRKALPKVCSQISAMSATLEPHSFVSDIGLDNWKGGNVERRISHIFDYSTCAALFVPSISDPSDADYREVVGKLFTDISEMVGGGVLGLFTSYKALEVAYEQICTLPEGALKHPPLVQDGTRMPSYLAGEFRKGDRILLGTKSFFQGMDFPGDCVKVVFLDKIPFKHFDDVIIQAMQYYKIKDWFAKEQLPHAKILFKQAFGRLIRRETDTGIVVCCDTRLIDSGYGPSILAVLPDGLPVIFKWQHFVNKLKGFYSDDEGKDESDE